MFSKFVGTYPEEGLLGLMVALFLIFWGTSVLFSIVAVPVIFCLSNSHSNSVRWFSYWFWFAFPLQLMILRIFSYICWPSVCLLWKSFYLHAVPIFYWIICFGGELYVAEFFTYFAYQPIANRFLLFSMRMICASVVCMTEDWLYNPPP